MASIYQSIEILSKEKGIDSQIILDAVKDAMVMAARKHFRTEENMDVNFDGPGGAMQLYIVKTVADPVADPLNELTLAQAAKFDPAAVVGTVIRIPKNADALGRISAQTAKQVILQKVREAERETLFAEFAGRVGELVNTIIKRVEGQDLVVDLGKVEARIPKKEQSRLESFSVGDRIRAVIKTVERSGKNAGVIISRAAPELVERLFEQEVPEIYDGTVQIRACAREAGERTKIAVASRDRDVDSVGACVGMKGMRVQSIIRELRGEKIDIIEYSEDISSFATHALSPARITRVAILDPVGRHMEVIVDDTQLSLAIGKKGQNVRLAAKLLGWRIDIKSEEEKRQEVESAMQTLLPGAPISVLSDYGLEETYIGILLQSGVNTVERLGSMTPEDLEGIPGVEPEAIPGIQSAVISYFSHMEAAAASQQAEDNAQATAEAESAPPAATSEPVDASVDGLSSNGAGPTTGDDQAEPAEPAAEAGAGTTPE